jgi:hypothetical protein
MRLQGEGESMSGTESGESMKVTGRVRNEPRKHFIDSTRGRANILNVWTLCGKAARACFVSRFTHNVTCEECHVKLASTADSKVGLSI